MKTEYQAQQIIRQSPTVTENDQNNADGLGIIDKAVVVACSLIGWDAVGRWYGMRHLIDGLPDKILLNGRRYPVPDFMFEIAFFLRSFAVTGMY